MNASPSTACVSSTNATRTATSAAKQKCGEQTTECRSGFLYALLSTVYCLSFMNYYEYFSEIEERFSQRRGSILLLSTLDWALIETWREAGIPLEAVLRGIDNAFDKHDARALRSSTRTRKVNGLAWCAQSVIEAVEQAMEASIGAQKVEVKEPAASGF